MAPKYPGNEMDPAEWLRGGRRYLGTVIILCTLSALYWGLESLTPGTRADGALLVGAFAGAFFGFVALAWTVFYVGRHIARILAGILVVLERTRPTDAVDVQRWR